MDELLRGGSKVVTVDDYNHLRRTLGAAVSDWSLTRLRRTVGSLHHNDRVLRISRKGEPMRDMDRPYVFLVTGHLKVKPQADAN
ncbi:hypothetical protein D3C73_275110 [compost metagenome]